MKQAFLSGCGGSYSGGLFEDNWQFYKKVTIANAARSQFDFDRYGKLPVESPIIGVRVIKGRGR